MNELHYENDWEPIKRKLENCNAKGTYRSCFKLNCKFEHELLSKIFGLDPNLMQETLGLEQ